MRRDNTPPPVRLDDCTIIRETDKALQVDVAGESHWFPRSQIVVEETEIYKAGEEGTLVVTAWIAGQKGLTP